MSSSSDVTFNMVMLLAGLIVLGISTRYTVRSATRVAQSTGISETSIGFLLLAFATSIPELSVTVISSGAGAVDLAVGNLLGSNAANIGLVLGVPFLLLGIIASRIKEKFPTLSSHEVHDIYLGLAVASAVPLFFLVWSFDIRILGAILVVTYLLVAYRMLRRRSTDDVSHETALKQRRINLFKEVLVLTLGIVGVVASSNYIVNSAVTLANLTGVSGLVIGAVIIAVGTSLPELAISMSAAISRHGGLAIGNAVGSCFTNITVLLGLLMLIAPVSISPLDFLSPIVFSLLLIVFIWYFIVRKRIKAVEAGSLVFLYILFISSNLGLAFTI